MVINQRTKTLNDVLIDVKRAFGDESGVQLTDTDITRWVNAGQLEIVSKTRLLKAVAQTDLIADQVFYEFPAAEILEVESLHVDGEPLPPMTFVEAEEYILRYDPERKDRGTPKIWYSYGEQIFLWPVSDTTVTNGVTLFYTPAPVNVTDPGDRLALPDKYFNALIRYVLYKAYEMDENFEAANMKQQEMLADLSEYAEDETKVYNRTYPTITVVRDDF